MPYIGTSAREAIQVAIHRSATRSLPMSVPTVSRTGRTAKYPPRTQKKRQNAATTAGISWRSMAATVARIRPSGDVRDRESFESGTEGGSRAERRDHPRLTRTRSADDWSLATGMSSQTDRKDGRAV